VYIKKLLFFTLLFLFCHSAVAQPEPWYLLTGIGTANNHYAKNTQDLVDQTVSHPHISIMQAMELELGAYWPTQRFVTLQGIVLHYTSDYSIEIVREPQIDLTIRKYALAYSIMHFITRYPGSGPFVRGDLGWGGRQINYNSVFPQASKKYSEDGAYILAGIGYGVRLSNKTKGLIELHYSVMTDQTKTSTHKSFVLNVLW
jgi:hypothetical protein